MPEGSNTKRKGRWMLPEVRKRLEVLLLKKHPYISSSYKNFKSLIENLTDDQLDDIVSNNKEPERYLGKPDIRSDLYKLKDMYPEIYEMYPNVDFNTLNREIIKRMIDGESPLDLLGKPKHSAEFYRIHLEALRTQYNLDHPQRRTSYKREGSPKTFKMKTGRSSINRSEINYHGGNYSD